MGRINILKINVLPRLLYLFQSVPVCPPRSFFVLIKWWLSLFGAKKLSRIARTTLTSTKLGVGLAIPDIKAYYLASVTARILDWFHPYSSKLWIQLESSPCKTPVTALPWTPNSSLSIKQISALPQMANTTVSVIRAPIPRTRLFTTPPPSPFLHSGYFVPLYPHPDQSYQCLSTR